MVGKFNGIKIKILALAISASLFIFFSSIIVFFYVKSHKESLQWIIAQRGNEEINMLVSMEKLKMAQVNYTQSQNEDDKNTAHLVIKKKIYPFVKALTSNYSEKPLPEEKALAITLKNELSKVVALQSKIEEFIESKAALTSVEISLDTLGADSSNVIGTTSATTLAEKESDILRSIESVYGKTYQSASKYFNFKREVVNRKLSKIFTHLKNHSLITLILLLSGVGVTFFIALALLKDLNKSLRNISGQLQILAEGGIPDKLALEPNEIGQLIYSANIITDNLNKASKFALSVGEGKYDVDFSTSSDKDILSNSLLQMREKLMKVTEEDKIRNWSVEGVAKIVEIIREHNQDFASQIDSILKYLVKYINATQGGLFMLNDEERGRPFLELKSCYAFERKKFIEKKIDIGDGLVGQAYLEKDIIYITEVPDKYVRIRSGLGDSVPGSLLIVPLIVGEEVVGVIELASLKPFKKYEVEFIQKIGETIASAISSIKITQKTAWLLSSSQEQTEQLRSQEEEMRQNLEELQATQDQMQRKENEMQNLLDKSLRQKLEIEVKVKELSKINQSLSEKEKDYLQEIEFLKKELELVKNVKL